MMPLLQYGEYRPDISDYEGTTTKNILNVLPRGDGYGPFKANDDYSGDLPAACRGGFYALKSDGSVVVFAGTSNRLYRMSNTNFTWVPVSKFVALTSISSGTPGVFTKTSHGLSYGDPVVFSTTGTLPSPLVAGTVYYVREVGSADIFAVSATLGGAYINTTTTGSGTHSYTAPYSALSSDAQWQFAQFGNFVIAVQENVAPQVYDLSSSSAFADLGGSPPQASYISIVGRFVVLSGLLSNPYRIQWSGLNATTTWTSGTNSSDYQDLPDGGIVRGVAGGEYGTIFQDQAIRRMIYAPGSPLIFQIERIAQDKGLYAPYSLVRSGEKIFFHSSQGFHIIDPGSSPKQIGRERVDRTFFDDLDRGNLQLFIGAADPRSSRVFWAYRSISGVLGLYDKIIGYDYALDRWFHVNVTGEYLLGMSQSGITLESLDSVSSSLDSLPTSLDGYATSVTPEISQFSSSHKLGFFRGDNLEATMETAEQGADGRRIFVKGFRPVTDASLFYGSASYRETVQDEVASTSEVARNTRTGRCDLRKSTCFSRFKVRIPAGTTWTYSAGVEPDLSGTGVR